jgi:chemotaxis protein methyltransferase CheR
MNAELEPLAELVRRESGINLKPAQHASLRAALGRAAPGVDPTDFLALAVEPIGGRELLDRLLDEVAVKETSFLRDARQLATIDWNALLESARTHGDGHVRAWSAGCATGEEPYTLALLACEAFGTAAPPVRILATDLSRAALAHAAAGRYRPRAVRDLDPEQLERWFVREDDTYVVDGRLRALVELERHNLVRDPVPPLGRLPFDLILCRNVMIYFDLPTVESVIGSLERALRSGGSLVVGAADALCGTGAASARPADRRQAAQERRPLGRSRPREDALAEALRAADAGRRDEAIAHAAGLLADNPLDADAYFLRGLVQLESGELEPAVGSLRRALYIDPSFGLAAFKLGRAHDALGDVAAARRAYEQALRTIAPEDERHEVLLQQVDLGDVAAACRARLGALR